MPAGSGSAAPPADQPLVSVILPVRNRAAWVARAIESVLAQSHRVLELLVVDDGSTDDTPRVLATFGSPVVRLFQAHAGTYAARNLALREARGEFIAFIDSDDVWLPDRLSRQLPLFARPEVGLVFGEATRVEYGAGGPVRLRLTTAHVSPPRRGHVAPFLVYRNFIPTCTALVRRRCFGDVGPFDAGVPLGADYQKWLQIALQHEVDYVSGPVAEYAIHAGNTSRDLVRTLRCRAILFERALEQASDPEARAIWRHALFNLHVSLALALARSGGSGLRELIGQRPAGPPGLSLWRRVDWLARFAGEQLRVRSAHLRPRRMEAEAAGPEATSPRRAARPG